MRSPTPPLLQQGLSEPQSSSCENCLHSHTNCIVTMSVRLFTLICLCHSHTFASDNISCYALHITLIRLSDERDATFNKNLVWRLNFFFYRRRLKANCGCVRYMIHFSQRTDRVANQQAWSDRNWLSF